MIPHSTDSFHRSRLVRTVPLLARIAYRIAAGLGAWHRRVHSRSLAAIERDQLRRALESGRTEEIVTWMDRIEVRRERRRQSDFLGRVGLFVLGALLASVVVVHNPEFAASAFLLCVVVVLVSAYRAGSKVVAMPPASTEP